LVPKAKDVKALYYGATKENKERAQEFAQKGAETKILPTEQTLPLSTVVVGNTVLNSVWGKKPITFKMENKTVADSLRENFRLLWKQDVQTFKSPEAAFDDILESLDKGDEMVVMGFTDTPQWFQDFLITFHKKRSAAGIKMRGVNGENLSEMSQKLNKLPYSENRLLPMQKENPVAILIYKDKTLFSLPRDGIWMQVKNQRLADSFRIRFEELWEQEVKVFHGLEGVHSAWETMLDELKSGEEYYVLGGSWRGQKEKVPDYFKDFQKSRIAKGIKAKFLFHSGTEKLIEEHSDLYTPLAEVKFLPQEIYEGLHINLYKNKVLIIVWREKEPIVFSIDDEKMYRTFKTYFDTLWEQDTTVSKGLDGLYGVLKDYLNGLEPGETYNVVGATFGVDDSFFNREQYKKIFKKIHEERAKKGVKARLLFQQRSGDIIEKFRKDVYGKDQEAKVLPYKTDFPVAILSSKKKTVITVQKEEPITISINNEEASQAFQKHFDSLWEQDTQTLRGFEGTKHLAEDVLETGEDLYLIGATGDLGDLYPEYYHDWTERRIKKGLSIKLLADQEVKKKKFFMEMPMAERAFLPKEYSSPNVIWIYGDKVANLLWLEEPIVFIIENKQLADHYRSYFEMLKKIAT